MLRIPAAGIQLGSVFVSAHVLVESLAYFIGFRLYLHARRAGDFLSSSDRLTVVAAAFIGAALGSKVLGWCEHPLVTFQHWNDIPFLLGGKTIVGAIFGGTLTVEWVKRRAGIHRRTGDLFAVPLAIGTAIGRIGCLLSGLEDHTYGTPTRLSWAVDFGDGIPRHPTQAYEIAAMLCLAVVLDRFNRRPHREGDTFRLFLICYVAWRLAIDFLKPDPRVLGLSTLQWVCLFALLWYTVDWYKTHTVPDRSAAHG